MKAVQRVLSSALITLLIMASVACGGGAPEIRTGPPLPVTITLTPSSATVFVGQSQQFTAQVVNSSNQSVTWQVNGVTGGNTSVGTISAGGLYTAPATVASTLTVSVMAVPQADSSVSASVVVTVPPVMASITPASATVFVGESQQFTAQVVNSSNQSVTWQVNGVSGGNASVGTISSTGLYTAPATVASTMNVTVRAVAQADATKSASASVAVPAVEVAVSPASAMVFIAATQQFTASVSNAGNTAVTWQVNGINGGNASVGTISSTGLYTAPASVNSTTNVAVRAVAQADSSKSASASVTVPAVAVAISPSSATVFIAGSLQFTATVSNAGNTAVTWQVDGVPGGNNSVGTISAAGLYTAPASAASTLNLMVTAVAQADATKSASAGVTVPPVSVAVMPSSATVFVGESQQLTATVSNSINQAVTWQVNGVTGGNASVGTISAAGLYTAPASVASTLNVTVEAIAQADASKSASAAVAVPPVVVSISPSDVNLHFTEIQAFTALVSGSSNPAVTWSVQGGPAGGTITTGGVYTAPSSEGTFHVVATSQADSSRSAAATVQVLPAQSAGTFTLTGSMTTPRSRHTATLLLDSRVLITGGDGTAELDSPFSGSSAELYDPATGTFVATGSMITPRADHTATLLPNGQVLIVGPGASSGAELYDPGTGTFFPTGGLLTQQTIQNATLLANGKVLVAGNAGAELYDPASGTFATAGAYAIPSADQFYITATLLSDGRVLFIHGDSAAAQVYDPATNAFSPTGSLTSGNYLGGVFWYSATLLSNGKVLVAGGGNDYRFDDAELYDPATGTFAPTSFLHSLRESHTATLLPDSKVLIAGGEGCNLASNCGAHGSLASTELYDPSTGSFAGAAFMNQDRVFHQATPLTNGDVLITGGSSWIYPSVSFPGSSLASAELYHPRSSAPAP